MNKVILFIEPLFLSQAGKQCLWIQPYAYLHCFHWMLCMREIQFKKKKSSLIYLHLYLIARWSKDQVTIET